MKKMLFSLLTVCSLFLVGCLETTQEVTINEDGSGTASYTTDMSAMISMLKQMGSKHAMVVQGRDGMDEITLTDTTLVAELKDGKVFEYEIDPRDYGFKLCTMDCLNAGAAIYTANVAPTLKDGIAKAKEVIASGAARDKLDALVAKTQQFKV